MLQQVVALIMYLSAKSQWILPAAAAVAGRNCDCVDLFGAPRGRRQIAGFI